MLPAEGALFSPSVGERPFHPPRVSANDTPILRRRRRRRDRPFTQRGREFRPRRARKCTLRRAGTRPSRGEGQKGTGHQGFLSPLATPQLSFKPRLPAVARLKAKESTDFTSVLSFFCVPWLCDCVVCRA